MTVVAVLVASTAALGVIGAQLGILWWMAKWARSGERGTAEAIRRQTKLADRIDELQEAVKDRDRAIDDLQQSVSTLGRRLDKTRESRNQALELARQAAADHPELVADSIRSDLERLRALSEQDDMP